MSMKSTTNRYGSVAIALHWTSALAILGALGGGLAMANSSDPALIRTILPVHIVLGTTALVLTLTRIAWWIWADKRPQPVPGQPGAQELAARIVHGLLYVAVLILASSGVATIVLSGAIGAILSGAPLPDFDTLIPRMAHEMASNALLVLLALHVGAAAWHQFVRRDRLLARMGVGASRETGGASRLISPAG
jgi:cytochrome b561